MGYVLSPEEGLPEGFGAEVRRESFYVYGAGIHEAKTDPTRAIVHVYEDTWRAIPGEAPFGTVEFMLEDIPKLRQILDAIETHRKK